MPRQRQTRTRTDRKGKKLKGLTKQEAILRSKKGWETRWRKYGRAAARGQATTSGPRPGGSFEGGLRQRQVRARARIPTEDLLKQVPAEHLEELLATQHLLDTGGIGQEEADRIVRELAKTGRAPETDPQILALLDTPAKRAAFQALIRTKTRASSRAAQADRARRLGVDIKDLPYIEPGKGKEIRHNLLPLLNPAPIDLARKSTTPPSSEREAKAREHGQDYIPAKDQYAKEKRRPSTRAERMQQIREEDARLKAGVPKTEEETRKQARATIKKLAEINDPADAKLAKPGEAARDRVNVHGRVESVKGTPKKLRRQLELITTDEQKQLEDLIVESWHGPSAKRRSDAAREAQKLIGRISTRTDRNVEVRTDIGSMVPGVLPQGHGFRPIPSMEAGAGLGILPKGSGQDPRHLYTLEDIYPQHTQLRTDTAAALDSLGLSRTAAAADTVASRAAYEKKLAKFELDQRRRKVMGFIDGSTAIGIGDSGLVPGRVSKSGRDELRRKSKIAVYPNQEFTYRLNDLSRTADKEGNFPQYFTTLRPYDREPRFSRGLRDQVFQTKDGQLIYGDRELRQHLEASLGKAEYEKRMGKLIQAREQGKQSNLEDLFGVKSVGERLRPGEVDEIVSAKSRRWYTEPVTEELGRRVPAYGPVTTPRGVDEVVYVPLTGAKGQTHRVVDTSGRQTETYEIRSVNQRPAGSTGPMPGFTGDPRSTDIPSEMADPTTGSPGYKVRDKTVTETGEQGRWRSVTKEEYQSAVADWESMPAHMRKGDQPFRKRVRPRVVQRVFVDPSDLRLDKQEVDWVTAVIPGTKTLFVPKAAQQFNLESGPQKKLRLNERAIGVQLADARGPTAIGQVAGPYFRARDERRRVQRMEEASLNQQLATLDRMHALAGMQGPQDLKSAEEAAAARRRGAGFTTDNEQSRFAQDAAAAGLSLGVYKGRRFIINDAKTRVNWAFQTAQRKSPRFKDFATRHKLQNFALDIQEGYEKPLVRRLEDLKYGIQYPHKSMSGRTHGIDLGMIYSREEGLRFDIPFFREQGVRSVEGHEANRIRRITSEVDRIRRTRERVRSLPNNPIGRYLRKGEERAVEYREFASTLEAGKPSLLDKHISFAQKIIDAANDEQSHVVRGLRDPITSKPIEDFEVTPVIAGKYQKLIENLRTTKMKEDIAQHNFVPPMGGGFHVPHPNLSSRNAKIVGGVAAVAAAAVATDYGIYKYRQHKLPKDERVAYYNARLPKPFHLTTPHIQATGHYTIPSNAFTRESGFAGDKIPVQFGISMKKNRYALRPMDRRDVTREPYAKNLPIGFPRLGGGTKGGSGVKSLVFFADDPIKKSFRRGNTDVFVKGRRIPGTFNIGKQQKIKLSAKNPRRMTDTDRENIIWATKGTPDEISAKIFYSTGQRDKIVDMFDDPEVLDRISKRKDKDWLKKREKLQKASRVEGGESYVHAGSDAAGKKDESFFMSSGKRYTEDDSVFPFYPERKSRKAGSFEAGMTSPVGGRPREAGGGRRWVFTPEAFQAPPIASHLQKDRRNADLE